jgi:hypothetical protein
MNCAPSGSHLQAALRRSPNRYVCPKSYDGNSGIGATPPSGWIVGVSIGRQFVTEVRRSGLDWQRRLLGMSFSVGQEVAASTTATSFLASIVKRQPDLVWTRRAGRALRRWLLPIERAQALRNIRLSYTESARVEPAWLRELLDGALRDREAIAWMVVTDFDGIKGVDSCVRDSIMRDFREWKILHSENLALYVRYLSNWSLVQNDSAGGLLPSLRNILTEIEQPTSTRRREPLL